MTEQHNDQEQRDPRPVERRTWRDLPPTERQRYALRRASSEGWEVPAQLTRGEASDILKERLASDPTARLKRQRAIRSRKRAWEWAQRHGHR